MALYKGTLDQQDIPLRGANDVEIWHDIWYWSEQALNK